MENIENIENTKGNRGTMKHEGHSRDRMKTQRGKAAKPKAVGAFDRRERRVNWQDLVEDEYDRDDSEL